MDLAKLALVAQDVLSIPYIPKSRRFDWAGVYVFGDDKEFVLKDHIHAIHAFFVYSQYDYPLYFFINQFKTDGIKDLLRKYNNNITFIPIQPLKTSFEYNYFMINRVWHLLPKHKYCVTFQFDGWLLKAGFEREFESGGYSFAGASWKEPIRVKENIFNFNAVRVGNGGFSFRQPAKMLEVLDQVNKRGGQIGIVKGLYIDGQDKMMSSPYIAEDLFFSYFGQGLDTFKVPTVEAAAKFSLEPMPFSIYQDFYRCPFGFHRIDE